MKTLQNELNIELEPQEIKSNPKQSLYTKMNDNVKEMKHAIAFDNLLKPPSIRSGNEAFTKHLYWQASNAR